MTHGRPPPTRFCVVGTAGAGKSHLARRLASRLGLPQIDVDAFYHRPGWQRAPYEEFVAEVRAALAVETDGWVVDGSYADFAGDAQLCVWLDYPRWLVMSRLVRRTFLRVLLRRGPSHGNRETLRRTLSRDPQISVLAWSWTSHATKSATYGALAAADPSSWIRLRSPRETDQWLASQS